MKQILFTGGGGAGSEALLRLLDDRYRIYFADADVRAIHPAVPDDRRCEIPFADDPVFGAKIEACVHSLNIDLLIPGVDEELPVIARLVEQGRLAALLPPRFFVDRHLDKAASMRFLAGIEIAPQTVPAAEAAQIGFPCIVKPRRGRGSRGVVKVDSPGTLAARIALSDAGPEDLIAQEYLRGEEFTVMMAADAAGTLRAVVPVAVEIKRGITLRAHTCRDRAVEEACRAVHDADPVPGCYNIQLIREPSGRVRIFEINPRVSTTLCLGVAAGVDPIGIYLSPPSGSTPLPFHESLRLSRHWTNRFDPQP